MNKAETRIKNNRLCPDSERTTLYTIIATATIQASENNLKKEKLNFKDQINEYSAIEARSSAE